MLIYGGNVHIFFQIHANRRAFSFDIVLTSLRFGDRDEFQFNSTFKIDLNTSCRPIPASLLVSDDYLSIVIHHRLISWIQNVRPILEVSEISQRDFRRIFF